MPFTSRRHSYTDGSCGRRERKKDVDCSDTMNVNREDYSLEEQIGKGAYGVIYRATHLPTGMSHAIKIIATDEIDNLDDIQAELSILRGSQCPQLPRYYGSFTVDSCLWIVMELLEEGSLQSLMEDTGNVLDQRAISWTMKHVLQALTYLHGERKLHRDIKAGNILIDRVGHVYLGDFGVSAHLTESHNKCNTLIGSPYWMAPEVISSKAGYNSKADIWSLGITAIELALGRPPLSEMHPMKALLKIPEQPSPTLPEEGPHGLFGKKIVSFIECCLKKNPSDRPSALDLLKHPFIKGAQHTDTLQTMLNSSFHIDFIEEPNIVEYLRRAAKVFQELFNTDTTTRSSAPSDSAAEAMGATRSNVVDHPIANWNFTLDTSNGSRTYSNHDTPAHRCQNGA